MARAVSRPVSSSPSLPSLPSPLSPAPASGDPRRRGRLRVLVTGLESDSHTWNLVYIALVVREQGHDVVNLGPCVPDRVVVRECRRHHPDLVVISTVNGHGLAGGVRLMRALRRRCRRRGLAEVPVVIGGKLTTSGAGGPEVEGPLLAAGYTAVFADESDIGAFTSFLAALAALAATATGAPVRAEAPVQVTAPVRAGRAELTRR